MKYKICPTSRQERLLEWTVDKCKSFYVSCLLNRKSGMELSMIRKKEKDLFTLLSKDIHPQVLLNILHKANKAFFRKTKEGDNYIVEDKNNHVVYPNNYVIYPQSSFVIVPQGLKLLKIGTIKFQEKPEGINKKGINACIIKRENKRLPPLVFIYKK